MDRPVRRRRGRMEDGVREHMEELMEVYGEGKRILKMFKVFEKVFLVGNFCCYRAVSLHKISQMKKVYHRKIVESLKNNVYCLFLTAIKLLTSYLSLFISNKFKDTIASSAKIVHSLL